MSATRRLNAFYDTMDDPKTPDTPVRSLVSGTGVPVIVQVCRRTPKHKTYSVHVGEITVGVGFDENTRMMVMGKDPTPLAVYPLPFFWTTA